MKRLFQNLFDGYRFVLSVLILTLLLTGSVAAVEGPSEYKPDFDYYLDRIKGDQGEGFISREIRRFRSYPYLDRAYKQLEKGLLDSAISEIEKYLSVSPQDLKIRVFYLSLLDRVARYEVIIQQTNDMLDSMPGFVPALFYKGKAFNKLGRLDMALESFKTASSSPDIKKEDKIFALTSAVDLAMAIKKYNEAYDLVLSLSKIKKDFKVMMNTGNILGKLGREPEALTAYTEALDMAKAKAEQLTAYLSIAETAKKLDNLDQAHRAYIAALELEGENTSLIHELALLSYSLKKYDEAEQWIRRLIKIKPGSDDREFLANILILKKDYRGAVAELKPLAEITGDKEKAYDLFMNLGFSYNSTDNPKKAAEAFYNAFKMKADKRAGRALRLALEKYGVDEEGVKMYKIVLDKYPDDAWIKQQYRTLLAKSGKPRAAKKYIGKALKEDMPDVLKIRAHKRQSFLFEKSGQFEKAAEELKQVLPLSRDSAGETLVRIAVLLNKADKTREALHFLDLSLDGPLPENLKLIVYRERGFIYERLEKFGEAIKDYEQALALGGGSRDLYLILSQLYQKTDNPQKALQYLRRFVELKDISDSEKCAAIENMGMLYLKMDEFTLAAGSFERAVQVCGGNWKLYQYLGITLYKMKRWEESLDNFLLAGKYKQDAVTLMNIGMCYKELNKPGVAVYYLRSALDLTKDDDKAVLKTLYDNLGYLYAEELEYEKAADVFSRSLVLRHDDTIALKLSMIKRLLGKKEESQQLLYKVDPAGLQKNLKTEYYDERAELYIADGESNKALESFSKAGAIMPGASRDYRIGLLYLEKKDFKNSSHYFSSALDSDRMNNNYANALGYSYLEEGRNNEAIQLFGTVLSRDPDYLKLYEELGYLNMKTFNNEKAVLWFKNAIDNRPLYPVKTPKEEEQLNKDIYRLRGEVLKLNNNYDAIVYYSYRSGNARHIISPGGQFGTLTGGAGIEFAVRPPKLGFRDERIFQVFSRLFGGLRSESLSFDEESLQGGIGMRYKPLRTQNLWVSGEHLFKLGANSTDDWLFRLLYSIDRGAGMIPWETVWDYGMLYGEYDYFVKDSISSYYVEARKGFTLNYINRMLIIPHLVVDARYQTPFAPSGSYLEGGAGLTFRYLYNQTKYENFKNSADLNIHYKFGRFMDDSLNLSNSSYNGVIITLAFFF